jgi:hypothetical protein
MSNSIQGPSLLMKRDVSIVKASKNGILAVLVEEVINSWIVFLLHP